MTRTTPKNAPHHEVPPGRDLRVKRLLGEVEKNPAMVLEDRRCLKPYFCEAFFDLCDDKCLRGDPKEATKFAEAAVELATRTGDQHLLNRAHGVRVHAHIASEERQQAEELLARYEDTALACCRLCQGEFFRRRGDLLVESKRSSQALDDLVRSVGEMGGELDPDTYARVRFIRGIGYHHENDPGRALDDAGKALLELSFDSPRGYFLDTLAFIGCFLQKGEERHFEQAKHYLTRFRDRIKGLKDWTDVRDRLLWVEGVVFARLDDPRALKRLTASRRALFESGPVKHALACAADEGLYMARKLDDRSLVALRTLVSMCLKLDLDKKLKRRVEKVETELFRRPEKAYAAFSKLRRHLLVPVPGLL